MFALVRHRAVTRCLLLAITLLAGCTTNHNTAGPTSPAPVSQASPNGRPNIVYVLTDDLSDNLVQYMPHVQQLQKDGLSFPNFFVTDSLCCPSRSSIFTGEYPHDTGVFTNNGDDGGFAAFQKNNDEQHSFGLALQAAGYRTGFMGKYLNGYEPTDPLGTGKPYVPPGWNEWDVAGSAYSEFNYDLNQNGTVQHYGKDPQDYLTDVLSAKGTAFVDSSAAAHAPFLLEVATFAPHKPSTPAPRDANAFADLTAPRTPAYGTAPKAAPPWLAQIPPLGGKADKEINAEFVKRVQSVQAVDAMIGNLEQELQRTGQVKNTYVVFGSDNGYHMGEHNLLPGKQTAFDTDINVPLIVTGPGVPAARQATQLAENIDMNPTFIELAGGKPAASTDGRSLEPLLHDQPVSGWRQAVLIEHHHPGSAKNDPDAAGGRSGNPPSYEAIRTADTTYVEYADGEREYYDLKSDPDELNNLAATPPPQLTSVRATLAALSNCHGADSCWASAQLKR